MHRALVTHNTKVNGKLDTGGSVSLSHSSFLRDIKDCKEHSVPKIKLSGVGGATPTLNKAGFLVYMSRRGTRAL
jgi:hypothetical protein